MEREELLRQLAAWRDGIDPASGSVLSSDHPAQRTEFLRLVCATIDALAPATEVRRVPAQPGRANAGRPWSAAEDTLLAQAHAAGTGVAELARAHERTPGAITARLVKLELIALPLGLRLRGMAAAAETLSP